MVSCSYVSFSVFVVMCGFILCVSASTSSNSSSSTQVSGGIPSEVEGYVIEDLSFFPPLHVSRSGKLGDWRHSGSAVITEDFVRLTPADGSHRGSLWNRKPLDVRDWEINLHFRIHGPKSPGADGLAFFYVEQPLESGPLYGSATKFRGLAIILDSFDNDGNRDNPKIQVVHNPNGNVEYKMDADGLDVETGSCVSYYRNLPGPAILRIRYVQHVLTVDINMRVGRGDFVNCIKLQNIDLPRGYYLGLSAETGDLFDFHDIFSFETIDLSPEEAGPDPEPEHAAPSSSFDNPEFVKAFRDKMKKMEQSSKKESTEYHPEVVERLNRRNSQLLVNRKSQAVLRQGLKEVSSESSVPSVPKEEFPEYENSHPSTISSSSDSSSLASSSAIHASQSSSPDSLEPTASASPNSLDELLTDDLRVHVDSEKKDSSDELDLSQNIPTSSSLSSSALHSESKPDSSCASCQSSITVITQRVAILQRMVKDIQDQVSGVLRTLENTPDAKKTQKILSAFKQELDRERQTISELLADSSKTGSASSNQLDSFRSSVLTEVNQQISSLGERIQSLHQSLATVQRESELKVSKNTQLIHEMQGKLSELVAENQNLKTQFSQLEQRPVPSSSSAPFWFFLFFSIAQVGLTVYTLKDKLFGRKIDRIKLP